MEIELAKKVEEMEMNELVDLFMKLRMEDRDAFDVLKELVEDM